MEGPLKLDTNLARCYNAFGNCYYGLNRPDTALEFYNKALKMREDLSGSDFHFDMPVYKNQIGTVHEYKGEYLEAVKCYKDALELLKDLKLTGYEDEALFRRNLANVYVRLEKFTEADEEAEKAYNIRQKVLGNHPDTVRSIFQQGVIQANLRDFKKALDFFLHAWEMEKVLGAGNQSAVWRRIIKGVFDMSDKITEKEKFRQDALDFCQRFWKDQKASPQFSFTAYNKEIIDCILYLLREKSIMYKIMDKKERALIVEYEREAIWFYDGMGKATDEEFNNEFDTSKDNKVLNEMLRGRTELLDKLIELCGPQDKHDQLLKYKRSKLMLFKKVLVRLDFVGELEQEKSTLKKAVEGLYKDIEKKTEKTSIKGFRESLLATWQQQWEEGKGAEETKEKLVAKERMIKGILQLCEELKMKDLRKRYGKEALNFGERLWEVHHSEMKPSVMKKFLNELKDLASSIGDRESVKMCRDALQDVKDKKQPRATLRPKALQVQMKPLLEQSTTDSGEEEEEIEVEADEDVQVVTTEATRVESEDVTTEGSDQDAEEVTGQVAEGAIAEESQEMTGSEEETEEESEGEGGGSVVVFEDTVTRQGTHWNLKQVSAHVTFSPDAVSEDSKITVKRWNSSVCSPPVEDNEALVSAVIELSTENSQGLHFKKAVTLVVPHCAADIKGYEVVAKRLIDRGSNVWADILETVEMRSLADIMKLKAPTSSSDIPDYFLPVVEFKVTQCSTFAVVCRLKSNEFTVTSEGNVLPLPEYPLFNVSIPENAVPKGEELRINVKLQEIPQRLFKGKEVWAGPILRITGRDSLQFKEPVTIQLPLSLREQRCEVPDMSLCRVRILFQETASGHYEWTDLTELLVTRPSCDGMAVKFSVTHFSGFWCWLEWCAQPMVWLTETMSFYTRRVGKDAFFAAYVSKDTRLDSRTKLRLYCCPINKRGKIHEEEGERGNIWLNDESSRELMYPEEKAYVFLSGEVVRPEEEGKFVRFRDCAFVTNVKVHVVSRGELTVEFCSSNERDGNKLLCKLDVTLPPQQKDPNKTPVEFFGLPFNDSVLHEARLTDSILTGCKGVLEEIGQGHIYEVHLHLSPPERAKTSFFRELAKFSLENQQKCFDQIVNTLRKVGEGVAHVRDRLLYARQMVNKPPNEEVCRIVAEKMQKLWKPFARDLKPKLQESVIENIEEEENCKGRECCHVALIKWCQCNGSQATNRMVMRCLTNMGYANVNWHIMKELGLVSYKDMPESERL